MIESMGPQKVVLMLPSMNDISWNVNKLVAMDGLSLQPGDELTIFRVFRLINPDHPSLHGAAKLLGYKSKGDSDKIFATDKNQLKEELNTRAEELQKNQEIMQLQNMCQMEKKVTVNVAVEAGASRKATAVRGAKSLGATWIILDRELKKDKQYFMDRLSCGISSMKSNNTVVVVRGPIKEHVSYDEMIPTYSCEDLSPSKQTKYVTLRDAMQEIGTHDEMISSYRSPSQQTTQKASSYQEQAQDSIQEIENTMTTLHHVADEKSTRHRYRNKKDYRGINEEQEKHEREREEYETSCSVCKNKRPKIAMQKDFSYGELREATKGFSQENFLSEGGFGFVFKGELKDGVKIAVKQLKAASLQGEKEFKSEVHVLSQARHQNLVVLLGSCSKGNKRLLVYEYVCNGSLEKHLSGESKMPLDWEKRINIALGTAKGLAYLHAHNIVHRDMRPSNILITHDHESRLGDFGLAKAQQDDSVSCGCGMAGTLGYMAPEYAECGKMSTKTDVYSFGMVMLQLLTGLRTTDNIPEGKSLIGWAKPLLKTKNYPDLIDKRIAESHDVHQLLWMVRIAECCLKKDPDERCTMEQVVHDLSCIAGRNTNFIRELFPTEEKNTIINVAGSDENLE